MAFYLLQENGDKIILEQGGGFVLLEDTSLPNTSVIYGGDDAPRKRRKPKPLRDIYAEIQQTIHALSAEILPAISSDAPTVEARQVDRAMDRLVTLARERQAYTAQVQQIKRDLAAYQQWLLNEDDAEWEWFL